MALKRTWDNILQEAQATLHCKNQKALWGAQARATSNQIFQHVVHVFVMTQHLICTHHTWHLIHKSCLMINIVSEGWISYKFTHLLLLNSLLEYMRENFTSLFSLHQESISLLPPSTLKLPSLIEGCLSYSGPIEAPPSS